MKKKIFLISAGLIFPIVFNIIFFLVGGTSHPASVWMSYGWIMFAYILGFVLLFVRSETKSSAVFSFSVGTVSAVYFLVELVVGIIFICIASGDYKFALIVQLVPFALYLCALFLCLYVNSRTAENEKRRGREIAFVRRAYFKVEGIMEMDEAAPLHAELEELYDLIHGSPVQSSAEAKATENSIYDLLDELQEKISDVSAAGDLIKKAKRLVNERNRLVSLAY